MSHEPAMPDAQPSERRRLDVWMVVAIVAIVLALVAAYFAFTYRQQVQDWEAAASETLSKLEAAGLELQETVVTGVADYEDQISDLTSQLEQAQTEAGMAQSGQAATEQELADTEAELEVLRQELDETQAALDDANARLAELGELVLPNGTYVGMVLAARTDPLPAIVFLDGDAWRVAEVADDVSITAGTESLTLEEFSALLQSTEPADAALANGTYEVRVKKGVVVSIRAAEE